MKSFKLYLLYKCLIIVAFAFLGCGIKPPSNYFKNEKKVGIIYIIAPIGYCTYIDYEEEEKCFFPCGEYREALNVVESKIRSKIELQIKDNYKNLFKEKGKSFIEIDHEQYLLHSDSLPEFNKVSSSKKSYYQYDLRPLKSQYFKDYEIDELLFVKVWYGLYYLEQLYILETRRGFCTISSEIVDLNDNSIIYKSFTELYGKIEGRWNTPPEYENLSNAIKTAISKSLNKQREKLIN